MCLELYRRQIRNSFIFSFISAFRPLLPLVISWDAEWHSLSAMGQIKSYSSQLIRLKRCLCPYFIPHTVR